jgi:phage shock protein A
MFDDLRAAFREALDNFNKELRRDQVPETVDRLLVGMRDEIVDEKAEIAGLEAQVEKTEARAEQEAANARTCRRREEMARRIDDEETATLAAQHATKHEGHLALLQKKAEAMREELAFRRRTLEEMLAKFNEAKDKRDALSATAGRSQARVSFSDADDLFGELDRMAKKIEGEESRGEAAEILDSLDLDGGSEYRVDLEDEAPRGEELDVDAALAELKRRMGESGTQGS